MHVRASLRAWRACVRSSVGEREEALACCAIMRREEGPGRRSYGCWILRVFDGGEDRGFLSIFGAAGIGNSPLSRKRGRLPSPVRTTR